jgi:hypothetical protein
MRLDAGTVFNRSPDGINLGRRNSGRLAIE